MYNPCDLAGARTQDPNIKSVVLYQLSYQVLNFCILRKNLLRVQNYGFFLDIQAKIHYFCILFLSLLQLLILQLFMNKKIILLGYMGSGKSTIGKLLATTLALPFIDLDLFIEEKEGFPLSILFKEKGQIYFRRKEQFYLQELLSSPTSFVLSLGGGTPCYGNAMELLRQATPYLFYLQVPTKELIIRLLPEKSQRPLIAHLEDESLEEFIYKHLFERIPFYSQAHFTIPCIGLSQGEILEKIISVVK